MYDIIKLVKKIFYSQPPKFWLFIAGVLLFLILIGPMINGVIYLIDPPQPTATPNPTPDINQTAKMGEPFKILDTYITVLGYQTFDSDCTPLKYSKLNEGTKGVVIEFWVRHVGDHPVYLNNFYLRDSVGTNYILDGSVEVSNYKNKCLPTLSGGSSIDVKREIEVEQGYGKHYYLSTFDVPVTTEDMELTFVVNYTYDYPARNEEIEGKSKVSVRLINDGIFEDPAEMLQGAPTNKNLSKDRTTIIGDVALAIYDTNRIGGDNDENYYYMDIMFKNISDGMLEVSYNDEFDFSVIDTYGVEMPASLSMNSGYNSALAPGETQKYYLVWQMEQASVQRKYMYLRIIRKHYENDVNFIEIPFKKSMIVDPTPTMDVAAMIVRARETETAANSRNWYPSPTPENQCINALPPRLKAGDTAGVTYTPPVANRLRRSPGFSGGIITMIQPGRTFYVMDGPVCADGLYWYYVNYNGNYGYTAESDDGQYWLEQRDATSYYRY